MIEFRLLGTLHLTDAEGREVTSLLTRPRRLALLAYLAAATPRGFHRRDRLLGLFWPEIDQEHARAALRQALHVLRSALGTEVVVTRGDEEIGLNVDHFWCDVVAFDEAFTAGQFGEALKLYCGPMLGGFFIPGAAEFERWLEMERTRLQRAASRSAQALVEQCETVDDLHSATEWARRAAQLAPHEERPLRQLVTLLDRIGDRAGAVAAYEEFAEQLGADLEAEPAAETKALLAAVRARETAAPVELASPASEATPEALARQRRAVPRVVTIAAAAALGLTAAALAFRHTTRPKLNPHRVVVTAFANRTGDSSLNALGEMAADWIARGLVQTGLIEVADRDSVGRPASGAEWLRRVADDSRAATVIWGMFYRAHDSLRLEAQISDAQRGSLLRSVDPVIGPSREPLRSIELLRQRVVGSLATVFDPKLNSWATMASQPPSYDAYRSLLAGLAANDRLDAAEAIRRFTEAAKLDSTYTLPLVYMAKLDAWRGACGQADSLARRLTAVRPALMRVDRFLLDRALAECLGDVGADYEAARSLADASPGSDYAAAELGRIAVLTNHPREAVAAFEHIDPERGTLRGNPTYYLWFTSALHMLGEHERELEVGGRARQQYPDNLATLREELFALAALGRARELKARLVAVRLLPPHPIRRPATVMRETALELEAHGFKDAAREVLDSSLAWLEGRSTEQQAIEAFQFEQAQTLDAAGRWVEAESIARRLAVEHPDNVGYLGLLGALAAQRGERDEAERIDRSLGALQRAYLRGYQTYWRAAIAARLGQRERAVALLTDAFGQGLPFAGVQPSVLVEYNRELHADLNFRSLRGFPPFQELLRPKG